MGKDTVPKILSPINSYGGAVRVINAGAKEIYCGVTLHKMKHFVLYRGSACNVSSYQELNQIIKFAHNHDVKVYLIANVPHIPSIFQDEYRNHISRCLDEGIDSLII